MSMGLPRGRNGSVHLESSRVRSGERNWTLPSPSASCVGQQCLSACIIYSCSEGWGYLRKFGVYKELRELEFRIAVAPVFKEPEFSPSFL